MCFLFAGRRRGRLPSPTPHDEARATVGKFLAIDAGRRRLIGMITEVSVNNTDGPHAAHYGAIARVDLMGEIRRDAAGVNRFRRGVSDYPAIGDARRPRPGRACG